ncbi:beta-ketoacyl-[acyl-carrier-protein] synthase family protein [Streptomyces sp. NBC_00249]|uniref:beta-ketoacyl-[acyl-carrier-protein] synthase family protein n=1 Tax=Streptomyces sp. NBC_00249 TaxID=2975690 RepID=UPI00224E7116|nr:beta-ketoacyl-[acyl-carrier-protein] synthase family protein [Streptomyces sp. NBC_00249]MCX5192993.1 beta-ketoacyl-[acyl-carrier-protein] synthase family protein [Streptomyces sp. NBC_00249]
MSRHAVAVTGLGMVTPAGVGVSATWDRLCGGSPTGTHDPLLDGLPVSISCQVADADLAAALDPGVAWRTDRFIRFAHAAAREAVVDAGLDPALWDGSRVAVVIGTGGTSHDTTLKVCETMEKGRLLSLMPTTLPRSLPNMAAGEVGTMLGALGPTLGITTACASGASAIGIASMLIRSGACDIAVAGGADSGRNRLASALFWRMGALSTRVHDPAGASRPFDAERDGFLLSEGAGILVLERAEHARARRAREYARLTGYGLSGDAHNPTNPHPQGDGAVRAITDALAGADLAADDVGHVNAHASATQLNDRAEATALRRVFVTPPPVTAAKSVLGHLLGAAGAVEAVCSVLSLHHQLIPPTANLDRMDPEIDLDVVTKVPRPARLDAVLSNSFGFGGQNAALVFQRP